MWFLTPLLAAIAAIATQKYWKREVMKAWGKLFKINTEADIQCFEYLWELYWAAHKFQELHGENDIEPAVNRAFEQAAAVANGNEPGKLGFRLVRRLPLGRRYVIFSDHHIAIRDGGHDFFRKNVGLYRSALKRYFDKDYELIENGDVFELLIFNPTIPQCKALAEIMKEDDPWEPLADFRLRTRLGLFDSILGTYGGSLFKQIAESFHAAGRYHLLMGNHDIDLQKNDFIVRLRKVYPGIKVQDFVVLDESRGVPSYVITHGHQFDNATHPRYAGRTGEAFSESLAWAFQGADRIWRWRDDSVRWTRNRTPFRNILATSVYQASDDFSVFGKAWEALAEAMLGHEIAWDYFESDGPYEAITKEVVGDAHMTEAEREWIKVRHMNECRIRQRWPAQEFDSRETPTLVLGHSHEVRQNALDAKSNSVFRPYVNTGSAGRFENLLWAVEIEHGQARVVSWHRANGPDEGDLVRLVYDSESQVGQLVPSSSHVPL